MPPVSGLDAREATAALRARSADRLREGFRRLVDLESGRRSWDTRDAMVSLTPFIDCARRLGLDPSDVLGPVARTGAAWYQETFLTFVRRDDVTLAAFGWALVQTPDGPAYRFQATTGRPARASRRS